MNNDTITAMLNGNINRMCVTDSEKELRRQRTLAIERINKLYIINHHRIKEESV